MEEETMRMVVKTLRKLANTLEKMLPEKKKEKKPSSGFVKEFAAHWIHKNPGYMLSAREYGQIKQLESIGIDKAKKYADCYLKLRYAWFSKDKTIPSFRAHINRIAPIADKPEVLWEHEDKAYATATKR